MSRVTGRVPGTLLAMLAALGLISMMFAVPVAAAPDGKVFVCKYVTTPDGEERLQEGGNPISVSVNSIEAFKDFEGPIEDLVGESFADGQGRSLVIEVDTGQAEPPTLEDCPPPGGTPTVIPLAPSVSDATCEAPGTLTLTAVEGVTYTIEPEYEPGDSGDFTVTATADEGFVIAEGAQTVFEVTVPAALDCPEGAEAVSPSVSGPTCEAPGMLTLSAVEGVTYTVEPAYTVGDSGEFTVTATAEEGFELTGETTFAVTVLAQKVCEGTQGGNPPSPPGEGTLGGNPVPDTAMDLGTTGTQTSGLLALIALSALGAAGFAARAEVRRRR